MIDQTPDSEATLALVETFIASVGRHDVDAILDAMTDDAVYENLGDDVDSGRHQGKEAIRAAFEAVFAAYPDCTPHTSSRQRLTRKVPAMGPSTTGSVT